MPDIEERVDEVRFLLLSSGCLSSCVRFSGRGALMGKLLAKPHLKQQAGLAHGGVVEDEVVHS